MANFVRTKHYAYACLGKRQNSKKKYRRPSGRHNKTRQKWKSRTPMVEVGYKNSESVRGLIEGKMPILISNISELAKVGKNNTIILAKIGARSKYEIVKAAVAKKLEISNLNTDRFIKKMENKIKKYKQEVKK